MPQSRKLQTQKKTSISRLIPLSKPRPLLALLVVVGVASIGIYAVFTTYAGSSKMFAPGTDVGHYPKLEASVGGVGSNHSPQKDNSEDTVFAVVQSGSEKVLDAYDAAPGETKHSLFQKLKAQNVPGVIDPDITVSDAYLLVDPGGTGSANCWTNGYAHGECWAWKNNGYAHPQVYFIDHTSSQWPVAAATYKWNQAHGIDSTYRWGTCPSTKGIHCVPVNSSNYGLTGWIGHTTMYNSAGIVSSANIKLNSAYNGRFSNVARASAHTACHEEGHALGLNHNSYYTSCMYPDSDASVGSTTPTSQDFSLLSTIYSIKR